MLEEAEKIRILVSGFIARRRMSVYNPDAIVFHPVEEHRVNKKIYQKLVLQLRESS